MSKFEVLTGRKVNVPMTSRVYSHITFGDVKSSRPFFNFIKEKWVSNPKIILKHNDDEYFLDRADEHADVVLLSLSRSGKDMGIGKLFRDMKSMTLDKELILNTSGMLLRCPYARFLNVTYDPSDNIVTIKFERAAGWDE